MNISNFQAFNEGYEGKKYELDTQFIDAIKEYFVEDGKFSVYSNRYDFVKDVIYWPKGIDPENFEAVKISDSEMTVYSGGDWQEGMYVTIALTQCESGDNYYYLTAVETCYADRWDKKKSMNSRDIKKFMKKYIDEK